MYGFAVTCGALAIVLGYRALLAHLERQADEKRKVGAIEWPPFRSIYDLKAYDVEQRRHLRVVSTR
jgi:hypothetical protein